jgi:hypothetical protein
MPVLVALAVVRAVQIAAEEPKEGEAVHMTTVGALKAEVPAAPAAGAREALR